MTLFSCGQVENSQTLAPTPPQMASPSSSSPSMPSFQTPQH